MPKISCPVDGCTYETENLDGAFAAVLVQQLQMHDKAAHSSPAPSQNISHKLNIDPPKISVGANPEEWESFTRQWEMFKRGTAVPKEQAATALFYCCHNDLRQDLMRDIRDDVSSMPESDLLAAIRRLAVKEESVLVHRMKLSKLVQSPGMGIRTYLANVKGQASLCKFTAKCVEPGCHHTFDYSDEIIKDTLVRGIGDPEILADLLGDTKTDRTLDETVAFIAQKEQAKATRSAVGDATGAIRGFPSSNPAPKFNSKCWACAGPGHEPRNDRNTRAKKCPAWSTTCTKCNIKGHLAKCCSKCASCKSWGHRDNASKFCKFSKEKQNAGARAFQAEDESLHSQLATVAESDECNVGDNSPVDHHVFADKWIARPSKPHPTIMVKLTPLPKEHTLFGHPVCSKVLSPIEIAMIADSGCQSSIMPVATARLMGYKAEDIMPVKLSMRGAISEDLAVEGGIILGISAKNTLGDLKTTKQLVYVSNKMNKAFLCREALENLGVISPDFPEIQPDPAMVVSGIEASGDSLCRCPRRGQEVPPVPNTLPPGLSGREEDVPALREWLLKYYEASAFNTCEHQPLPMMTGEPLQLHLDPGATPVAVHKPAMVPIHWLDKVKDDLDRDVKIGVLEKVPPNTPVTWCSRMVVTAKSDGSPRRTVDLQPQNKCSVRQTHHVPTPFNLADRIPQGTKKTITDAWNGYHSVPLSESDRHITTFITPWGRYRYKVAPQGFLASGDGYNQRFDAIIAEFPNNVKCVDDTCMWASNIEEAFFQTCRWLDICAKNGITLNPKKFQFAQDTVEFAGLTITSTNIRPNQKFLDSILNFPTPKDITGARAWFGLVNQGAYAFSMARQMRPMRELLRPSTKFEWTEELDLIFRESKQAIVDAMKDGVRLFDPSRPTCLATDWSNEGIGFLLKQKYCKCRAITPSCCQDGWHLCLVGSRFTTPAESRYAPVEGEALAVAYALHQTRYYISGCPNLIVATDHKPLVQILNDRSLSEISNRRLLNLKEKTLAYSFEIQHISGVKNKGPDAVSRYPSKGSHQECEDMADDEGTRVGASDTLYIASNMISWDMVKQATESDSSLSQLKAALHNERYEIKELPKDIRQYHQYMSNIYEIDGVLMMGQRLIIPSSLRHDILMSLHAAHQGIGAMIQRANASVFWPGISVDITRVRNECGQCHRIAKSNPMEPPSDIVPPEFPFQKICADYFQHNNKNYLVVVDRYSNWPTVYEQSNKAESLVKRLRELFVTFGVPEELASDGGPQFMAEITQTFLNSWGVHHRLSSVGNPHSNNRAEIAVKTVKRMLMANTGPTGSLNVDSFQRAMLIYRNSIDPETKTSPAIIIFGHPTRDPIPTPLGRYCPHPTWQETRSLREKALAKRHSKAKERWSEHTKDLKLLEIGDHVYVQNLTGNQPLRWERTGVIVETRPHQQYAVRVDGSGRVTLRNRKNLRKFTPFVAPREHPSHVSTSVPTPAPRTYPLPVNTSVSPPAPNPVAATEAKTALDPPAPSNTEIEPQAKVSEERCESHVPDTLATPAGDSDSMTEAELELGTPESVTTVKKEKIPRARARLLGYNKPGLKEL